MFTHARRLATIALTGGTLFSVSLFTPGQASAQVRQFQACAQGALMNCAGIRLTSQLGVGPSNTNLLEIGVQNLGSQAFPSLPTGLYFLSFFTGQNPDVDFVDAYPSPVAEGGATLFDGSSWNVFEAGDAIFLNPLGNDGIGGCVFGAPSGGFGMMGQTCGANQFFTFSFYTPRAFDLSAITVAGMEFVDLDANNTSDSCNDVTPCSITEISVVPEPSSLMLLVAGVFGIVAVRSRRRYASSEA